MRTRCLAVLGSVLLAGSIVCGVESEPIRLAADPALSPDGKTLAFAWRGDVWLVPTAGGPARQLTQHPADDRQPAFSPDGARIAFVSNRQAGNQVYVVDLAGGAPKQLTFHTSGLNLSLIHI